MKSISEITDAHLDAHRATFNASNPVVNLVSDIRTELEAREAAITAALRASLSNKGWNHEEVALVMERVGFSPLPPPYTERVEARLRDDVAADRQAVIEAFELIMPVAQRLGVHLPAVRIESVSVSDTPDGPVVRRIVTD